MRISSLAAVCRHISVSHDLEIDWTFRKLFSNGCLSDTFTSYVGKLVLGVKVSTEFADRLCNHYDRQIDTVKEMDFR